ncbi:MAG TPA: DNA repair protein RadA [Defluviitoga sp.]|nr:DNA repair protein RadA [Defluviitoga sp.]HPZ29064.1 DNA repair protein RadA [Defluviitoga sp.]HQD62646.1 DNA repair protein RadA [Defluviitoga sp.]
MKKIEKYYVCNNCGYETDKWFARCPVCKELESAVEYTADIAFDNNIKESAEIVFIGQQVSPPQKISIKSKEINEALNGGLVKGGVYLVSGEPGIGKSTLLTQLADSLDIDEGLIFYISGEESINQVLQRFERLNISNKKIALMFESNVETIISTLINSDYSPAAIFIDSIQTLKSDDVDSVPGSLLQVRECARKIVDYAKKAEVPVVLVGHVNKEGAIAGPKVLEHMVDCVIQIDLERSSGLRILKVLKNRFGPTDEMIILEITQTGLKPIEDITSFFLSEYSNEPGNTLTVVKVGHRFLPIEIQALVSNPVYGSPRRVTSGIPLDRLLMITAVLSKKLKLPIETKDIFVSTSGGLKISDSSMDLAIAVSLISSMIDRPLLFSVIAMGEIGLDGRVRTVSLLEKRIEVAQKLGADVILIPKNKNIVNKNFKIAENVKDLIKLFGEEGSDT